MKNLVKVIERETWQIFYTLTREGEGEFNNDSASKSVSAAALIYLQ